MMNQMILTSANNSDSRYIHHPLQSYSRKPRKKPVKPKHRRTLTIINVNCQSLKNKPEFLQNLADSTKPDIIGTESWLTKEVNDCEVFPNGYRMSTVYIYISTARNLIWSINALGEWSGYYIIHFHGMKTAGVSLS